ncbi:MAG TPA: alcohol dehydrogenase catalytic domain-containing protein, partial [Gammaproteobacteria bacterium]
MPNPIRGYAVPSAGAPVAPHSFVRRDPRPDDVVIDILYCGVCHTDIHHARNDWGRAVYPLVPGHEIIGRVAAVGAAVRAFKPGDAVGVGCLVDSCRSCAACAEGLEQHCEKQATWTYNDVDRHDQTRTYGGYSERILVSEKFVLRVPEGLELSSAAPLLCAGITLYSPLRRFEAGRGKQVAIVAMGGLG